MKQCNNETMKLVGHQKQWQFLIKSAEIGRLSHAYLFSGQSHLGKKTLAKEFIKLLNCKEHKNRLGQTCWSCQAFQKEIHPDLILIKPEGKEIKISQIRELQRLLSFRPHSSLYKAAILEEGEKMNPEAQSCLLKTLEEPSDQTLLFLITEYPEKLFPTILSRVQKIRFFPVAKSDLIHYLEEQGCTPQEAQEIALFAFGKPGLAIRLLQDPERIRIQQARIREMRRLSSADLVLRFRYAKELSERRQEIGEVLDIWLRYFRGMLLKRVQGKPIPHSYSFSQFRKIIHIIEQVRLLIARTNVNPRLALEQIMLEL